MDMNEHILKSADRMGVAALALLSVCTAAAQPYAYVANVAGNSISVVNTSTMTNAAIIPIAGSPSGLAVTPDGSSLYVALQGSNSVGVISTTSNSLTTTIPVGTSPVQLAISPTGALVYVANQTSNTVSVISTASKSVVATIPVGSKPMMVAFNPDGSRAYVTNLYSNAVYVIDTGANAVVGTFGTANGPSGIAVLPNGWIYVGNQFSSVVTVHDPSGNQITTVSGLQYPNALAATPDGSRVFATNGNGGSVAVIKTSTNAILATIPTGMIPTSVAISADGLYAYVTNEYSFTLSQINVANNTVATSFRVGIYPLAVATQPPPAVAPPSCTYSLLPSSASFTSAGGTSSVNITAPSGCTWTATSNTAWIHITSGASGSGNGIVNYSVTANSTSTSQSGTLTVGGQTFSVTEAGSASDTGSFDMAACTVIAGWAADRNALNQSITVDVYDGVTLIASGVPANLFRPDVGSYLGDNGLHGFSIATPASLTDGKTHSLTVRFGGTATTLTNAPQLLSCSTAQYTGSFDMGDCNILAGWAADLNRLNQSVTVDIYDGATLITSLVANVFRPDVGSYLGDNGLHGFVLATPASLKTNSAHSVSVKFGGTTTLVSNSPRSLTCSP